MEPRPLRIMLIANMAVSIILLGVLTLEAFQVLDIYGHRDASHVTGVRVLFFCLTVAFVFGNFFFIYEAFLAPRASHLKSKVGGNEFQVSVAAVEESLGRIAKCIPDVHDARVSVFKDRREDTPVTIEVGFVAYEDHRIPELTERIREVVSHRFEEIAGSDIRPQFEIVLSRIVEKEARSKGSRPKESKVIDLSKGPIYPVADDIPS